MAKESLVKDLIMKSDSQEVVNLINNRLDSRSENYWVVLEIQKLKESFDHISCVYTHRSCNVIAHSLAKLALEKCEIVVWKGSYPLQIMFLLYSLN